MVIDAERYLERCYSSHELCEDQEKTVTLTFTWNGTAWELPDGTLPVVIEIEGHKTTYTWKDEGDAGHVWKTEIVSDCLTAPTYDGTTPTKAADDDYTYAFDHWDGPVTTGDSKTYTAVYTPTAIPKLTVEKVAMITGNVKPGDEVHYQITVTNVGNTDVTGVVITDALDSNLVFVRASGTGGNTWNADAKPADDRYEFPLYTLQHGVESHNKVTLNIYATVAEGVADGTVIRNAATVDCPNMPADNKPGDSADITVDTVTVTWLDGYTAEPVKTATIAKGGSYRDLYPTTDPTRTDYRFTGWGTPVVDETTGDITITAQWAAIGTHTVTWLDEDGTTQIAQKTFRDGESVPTQDFADPTKDPDDDYTYEFAGWTRTEEDGDITYVANYTATARHKVTWLDEDGTTVLDGPKPFELDGTTEPTTDVVPTKDEDADNTYTFAAWVDRQVDDQGNVTYKARYTATAKYTVKWVDENGGEIATAPDKVKSEDDVPEFPGELPTAPEGKEFDKWGDPVVDDETHTITVPVVWKDKDVLTVKWVDEDGTTELTTPKTFFKGDAEPDYDGQTPTKASDATYNYSFKEWIKTTDDNGNITYTASYDATRKSTGGGGGGGNRPVNPPEEDLDDPDVPLADLPMLNQTDYFAYIIGKPDGKVYPTGNITRAEVVTIFFRIMTEEARSENWGETNEFSDVTEGMWYNHAVSTAVNAGLIKGMPDGTFGGDRNITRAEFATIAARFLDTASQPAETFTDIEGHWAEADINRATVAGWIKGVGDGKFNPDAYITRAEVMTLVNRMLNRKFDETNTLADMVVWPDNSDKDMWYYGDVQEATNDHEYERKAGTLTETWTKITEPRDWSELEK